MIKLHGVAFSNYYNKVKIALLEKGIPFTEEYCAISQEAAMLEKSPMGKIPFIELPDGGTLCETSVILEYLDDTYPANPLFPKDPVARARVRELMAMLELNIELVARRLYGAAFFGGTASDGVKSLTEKDLEKGIRAFKARTKFTPFMAGDTFTAVDCAGAVHLKLVSLATEKIYGRDVFAEDAEIRKYQEQLATRPSVARMLADRKAFKPR